MNYQQALRWAATALGIKLDHKLIELPKKDALRMITRRIGLQCAVIAPLPKRQKRAPAKRAKAQ